MSHTNNTKKTSNGTANQFYPISRTIKLKFAIRIHKFDDMPMKCLLADKESEFTTNEKDNRNLMLVHATLINPWPLLPNH